MCIDHNSREVGKKKKVKYMEALVKELKVWRCQLRNKNQPTQGASKVHSSCLMIAGQQRLIAGLLGMESLVMRTLETD